MKKVVLVLVLLWASMTVACSDVKDICGRELSVGDSVIVAF